MVICRKEIFKTIIEVVGMIMPLNDDRPFDDFSREPLNYKENVCCEAPRFSNKEVPAVGSKIGNLGIMLVLRVAVSRWKMYVLVSSRRMFWLKVLQGNLGITLVKRKLMDNNRAQGDGSKRDIRGAT